MPYYSRKPNRLPKYDYSTDNYYFITICTYQKTCIFGKPKNLNKIGKIVESCILQIQNHYSDIRVDQYIVMPNHIHILLAFEGADQGVVHPNLSSVIGQYKMSVTKKIRAIIPNCNVWQRSFYDHIVRNQEEYEAIWNYIKYNDQKWNEDQYYQENE